jgi:EXS family
VFINSVYSFWWDVVNDWGLTLLKPSSMSSSKRRRSMHVGGSHSRTGSQSPKPTSPAIDLDPDFGTQYTGLRSQLLFQDPLIYYVAIFINFVLRFTWSLKLSSHLHHVADLEVGVFMIEALEVLRRWIWVFIRVEWEMLKLGREAENDEEYEFLMREGGETDASDVSM